MQQPSLDTLDGHSSLPLQALPVTLLLFLLAGLESSAIVAFQHPVLATEMALAETAVADNRLCFVLAVFEIALGLLWSAATQRQGQMQCAVLVNRVVAECA